LAAFLRPSDALTPGSPQGRIYKRLTSRLSLKPGPRLRRIIQITARAGGTPHDTHEVIAAMPCLPACPSRPASRVPLALVLAGLAFLGLSSRGRADTVRESSATFASGGKVITVDCFLPAGEGKHPAVLLLHGADGLKVQLLNYRHYSRVLARQGYATFLVHYFDRTDTGFADLTTILKHFLTWMDTVGDAVLYAEKQPGVDKGRIALVGYSLGAFLSLSAASQDARIKAVVEYFGGMPDYFAGRLKNMPPTLILHGEADKIVPVAEARKLERLFKDRKKSYEIKIYAGAGHGLTGDANKDAIERTLGFLAKHLKAAGRPGGAGK
jgi:carboxymethylenebutenolidase